MAQGNQENDAKKRRRKRSPEAMAELVLEAERTGNSAAVCRREGIAPAQFSRWKQKFKEGGLAGLKTLKRGPRQKDTEKLALEQEILRLKEALCEMSIELSLVKKRTS